MLFLWRVFLLSLLYNNSHQVLIITRYFTTSDDVTQIFIFVTNVYKYILTMYLKDYYDI